MAVANTSRVPTTETSAIVADLFACSAHSVRLELQGNDLRCAVCGPRGRLVDGVFTFLQEPDPFYEGKYDNRTKYIPRNDGCLATLPLRIVLQGYPTTVATQLPSGSTVVDIGSAGGSDWFAQRYRMIGLDVSMHSLTDLARRYAVAVQASAVDMPFSAESVDGIVSSCVFEHFTAPDKSRILAECYRVLRPGGKLIFFYDIATDNPVISKYRDRCPHDYKVQFLEGDGHVGFESVVRNRAHFDGAGFKIIGESFHERTPLLSNSVWQKLAEWPGRYGRIGKIGKFLTSGHLRLPALTATALADGTLGRALPARYARCMTTVAQKI